MLKVTRLVLIVLLGRSFIPLFTGCGSSPTTGTTTAPPTVDVTVVLSLLGPDGVVRKLSDRPIPIGSKIQVDLSAAVDPLMVEPLMMLSTGGLDVAGTFSWNAQNTQALFTPNQLLLHKTTYNFSVVSGNTAIKASDGDFTTATAADLNGDGLADLAISAPSAPDTSTARGQVHIFFGGTFSTGAVSAANASVIISGTVDQQSIGSALRMGDFNGDGFSDLVVGVNPVMGNDQVSLFFGGANFSPPSFLDSNVQILNNAGGTNFGGGELAAADFNRDGFDDLVVAARDQTVGADTVGQVFLFLGAAGFDPQTSANATHTFTGSEIDGRFGKSLAVGDFNQDGRPDLVVGATGMDVGGSNRGQAFLFLNPAAGFSAMLTPGNASTTFSGAVDNLGLGFSMAPGDFNGDGRLDLAVSAPSALTNDMGQVVAFFAAAGGFVPALSSDQANATVSGNSFDRLGVCVSKGDFNGDGSDELLLGADQISVGSGKAYIFSGGATLTGNLTSANAQATFAGAADDEFTGKSCLGIQDVSGDNLQDLLIGAPTSGFLNSGPGRVYLLTGGAPLTGNLTPANATISFEGILTNTRFSTALFGLTD